MLELDEALTAIAELKQTLIAKGEATELFGQVRGEGLASALATIEQGFGDELFYPNVASRAAHLLYFVIKNHPLADGNKRCGSVVPASQSGVAGEASRTAEQRQYTGGPCLAGGGEPAGPENIHDPID